VSGTVLVTGGTGKTGRRVADQLVAAGRDVRIASRHSTIPFDWSDRGTWAAALAGVSAAYLVPPPGGDVSGPMIAFAQAAIAGGVTRFVLLSGSPMPEGGPGVGQTHSWLRENARDWAVMRPSWFMQNFTEGQHLAPIRDEGVIYSATEDGRIPFISADDIAACAVAALISEKPLNRDFILTGSELFTYDAVAQIISDVTGRRVTHQRVSAEKLAEWYRSIGRPDMLSQMLAAMDVMIAHGAEDRTTDCVHELTGRAPITVEAFARDNAKVWAR
jgi:ergot alkaloid biosynthesis protein